MGRATQLVLRNIRVLRSRLLNAAYGWRYWEREKLRSHCTVEAKRAKNEEEKMHKRKHVVESLHKPGIFDARFNHSRSQALTDFWHLSSTWPTHMHNAHWHGTAWGIMRMRSPSNNVRQLNVTIGSTSDWVEVMYCFEQTKHSNPVQQPSSVIRHNLSSCRFFKSK